LDYNKVLDNFGNINYDFRINLMFCISISPRLWHLLHHTPWEVYSCTYLVSLFQRALHIKRNKGGVLHCNYFKHMVLQCYLQMRLHWWHQLWRMDRLWCWQVHAVWF